MEIRHLLMIKSLVEYGSLTKAADQLFLTQSALSHQLKELEKELNVKIVDRVGKRMLLTPYGQEVYRSAINILKEEDKLIRNLDLLSKGKKGHITLSTGCYTSYHWLPALLRDFEKHYPEIEVKINVDATGKIIEKLENGEIDIGIINRKENGRQIDFNVLFKDEMVALVSVNHPWIKRQYVAAKDFISENLFVHSLPLETVTIIREVLKPKGIEPRKITELPLTEAVIEMVSNGYGVTVMARWAVKPYLDQGKVVPVKVNRKGLYRNHYVATIQGMQKPVYMDTFLKYVKKNILMN